MIYLVSVMHAVYSIHCETVVSVSDRCSKSAG